MEAVIHAIIQWLGAHWLAVLIGTIGVVGSIASIVSWLSSRRNRRIYEKLFETARQALEKEEQEGVLDKRLAEKQDQVTRVEHRLHQYSNKVVALQEQIQKDIPLEARRAVLRDRLDASLGLMTTYYSDVVSTQEELAKLGEEKGIAQELLMKVRGQIQPKYVLRERLSHLRTMLTIVTSAAALGSTLLPYPANRFVGTVILLFALPILIRLLQTVVRSGEPRGLSDVYKGLIRKDLPEGGRAQPPGQLAR